jgi:hypothetical protein
MHWAIDAGRDRRGRNGQHRLPDADAHFFVERTGRHAASAGNRLLHPALLGGGQLYKRVLRISVIAVVTLVLVLWDRRTGK